jgi:hypothetical protein
MARTDCTDGGDPRSFAISFGSAAALEIPEPLARSVVFLPLLAPCSCFLVIPHLYLRKALPLSWGWWPSLQQLGERGKDPDWAPAFLHATSFATAAYCSTAWELATSVYRISGEKL